MGSWKPRLNAQRIPRVPPHNNFTNIDGISACCDTGARPGQRVEPAPKPRAPLSVRLAPIRCEFRGGAVAAQFVLDLLQSHLVDGHHDDAPAGSTGEGAAGSLPRSGPPP
jgi:hypothetical protein